jgi:hypothetical protein
MKVVTTSFCRRCGAPIVWVPIPVKDKEGWFPPIDAGTYQKLDDFLAENNLIIFGPEQHGLRPRHMSAHVIGRKHDCNVARDEERIKRSETGFEADVMWSAQKMYKELMRELRWVRVRQADTFLEKTRSMFKLHDTVHTIALETKCDKCSAMPDEWCRDLRKYIDPGVKYNKNLHAERIAPAIQRAKKLKLIKLGADSDRGYYIEEDQDYKAALFFHETWNDLFS